MSYLLELPPVLVPIALLALLMVPYLGFLIGIILLFLALAAVLAAALGLLLAVPLLGLRAVRARRPRLQGHRPGHRDRRKEAELTRAPAA